MGSVMKTAPQSRNTRGPSSVTRIMRIINCANITELLQMWLYNGDLTISLSLDATFRPGPLSIDPRTNITGCYPPHQSYNCLILLKFLSNKFWSVTSKLHWLNVWYTPRRVFPDWVTENDLSSAIFVHMLWNYFDWFHSVSTFNIRTSDLFTYIKHLRLSCQDWNISRKRKRSSLYMSYVAIQYSSIPVSLSVPAYSTRAK